MPRRGSTPPPTADVLTHEDPVVLAQQVRRLLAEAQALSTRLAVLNEVAVLVQGCSTVDDVLRVLAREARWMIDFQLCSLAICTDDHYDEWVASATSTSVDMLAARPIGMGLIGRALQQGQPLLLAELVAGEGPPGMRSALVIVLRSGSKIIGALNFFACAPSHYTSDDLRIAHALAVQIVAALQNMWLLGEITRTHDELDQLRDTTISMLVHDLRTPLTGVRMGMDLLKLYHESGDRDAFSDVYTHMHQSSQRLLQRINIILDTRRIESGNLVLACEQVNLRLLLEIVLAPSYAVALQSQQTIVLRCTDAPPSTSLDPQLIERTVENLLGNALKFTPSGGQIIVALRGTPSGRLEFRVEDDGPGIPEAMRATIFNKYVQLADKQAFQGNGLGLAFCKLAVEAHGGTIGVRARPGGGSIFWFEIPASPPDLNIAASR